MFCFIYLELQVPNSPILLSHLFDPRPRITTRLTLLLLLCTVRSVVFLLEQPSSSVMGKFPYMDWLRRVISLICGWKLQRLPLVIYNHALNQNSFGSIASWTLFRLPFKCDAELSFMGSYGHGYLKPTLTFGSALGAKSDVEFKWIHINLLGGHN